MYAIKLLQYFLTNLKTLTIRTHHIWRGIGFEKSFEKHQPSFQIYCLIQIICRACFRCFHQKLEQLSTAYCISRSLLKNAWITPVQTSFRLYVIANTCHIHPSYSFQLICNTCMLPLTFFGEYSYFFWVNIYHWKFFFFWQLLERPVLEGKFPQFVCFSIKFHNIMSNSLIKPFGKTWFFCYCVSFINLHAVFDTTENSVWG